MDNLKEVLKMLNCRFLLIFLYTVFTLLVSYGEIHLGTAGSMSYYQGEINRAGTDNHISQDSSVTYTYPMGRVSARYSSLARGWYIGETSQITRDIKYRGVPNYFDFDIFTLDGNELIYSGGTNPRLYHCCKQNYTKIEYWDPDTGMSYWKVYALDGSIWYYGNTADSRIEAVDSPIQFYREPGAQPRVWAVASVCGNGNVNLTKYTYFEDTEKGGFYLTRITTGKTQAVSNGYMCTKIFYENIPSSKKTIFLVH
jgi:hypothetical protein